MAVSKKFIEDMKFFKSKYGNRIYRCKMKCCNVKSIHRHLIFAHEAKCDKCICSISGTNSCWKKNHVANIDPFLKYYGKEIKFHTTESKHNTVSKKKNIPLESKVMSYTFDIIVFASGQHLVDKDNAYDINISSLYEVRLFITAKIDPKIAKIISYNLLKKAVEENYNSPTFFPKHKINKNLVIASCISQSKPKLTDIINDSCHIIVNLEKEPIFFWVNQNPIIRKMIQPMIYEDFEKYP